MKWPSLVSSACEGRRSSTSYTRLYFKAVLANSQEKARRKPGLDELSDFISSFLHPRRMENPLFNVVHFGPFAPNFPALSRVLCPLYRLRCFVCIGCQYHADSFLLLRVPHIFSSQNASRGRFQKEKMDLNKTKLLTPDNERCGNPGFWRRSLWHLGIRKRRALFMPT